MMIFKQSIFIPIIEKIVTSVKQIRLSGGSKPKIFQTYYTYIQRNMKT